MPHRTAHPSVSRLPRRVLDPVQLVEFTRVVADEVDGGHYPFLDFDADERWHRRLYRDPTVDIWLISWLPTQGTELHDHGGSSGAFTVVRGALAEAVGPARRGRPGPLQERSHATGSSVGFGPQYVHDVRNLGQEPAVSVHAYSPPLTSMTFYDHDGTTLTPIASLATDDPEPDRTVRAAS